MSEIAVRSLKISPNPLLKINTALVGDLIHQNHFADKLGMRSPVTLITQLLFFFLKEGPKMCALARSFDIQYTVEAITMGENKSTRVIYAHVR